MMLARARMAGRPQLRAAWQQQGAGAAQHKQLCRGLAGRVVLGNPDKVPRGKSAELAKMTEEEKLALRNKMRRRSDHDSHIKAFKTNVVVVHPNGATSIAAYAHPGRGPVTVLAEDESNFPAFQPSDVRRKMLEKEDKETGAVSDIQARIFAQRKKRKV